MSGGELTVGTRVRVIRGKLAGMTGVIEAIGAERVTVRLVSWGTCVRIRPAALEAA